MLFGSEMTDKKCSANYNLFFFNIAHCNGCGSGSVVGIPTGYGLDGSGI